MRQLQIVDNLHAATSNRNMLKTGNGQSSAASPGTASPPHTITVLQTNSLPGLVQREIERMRRSTRS